MKALIAKKIGMSSIIAQDGTVSAITLLSAKDNVVSQLKDIDKDGYQSIQVAVETKKNISKAISGHLKPAGIKAKIMREFRYEGETENKIGDKLSADLFSVGDVVQVSGTSKGKGFAGTIKRHNFSRGRKTHGGRSYRRPGSIGSMYPQKIFKGKKMAGQMGSKAVTVKNLKVALIDVDQQIIGVYGAVPGPRKSTVVIKGAN